MEDNKKHMLLMAAKAAGISHDGAGFISESGLPINWNPLDDDGDALRLAVNLGMDISPNANGDNGPFATAYDGKWGISSVLRTDDKYADMRMAITEAAASIGERMP